MIIIVQDEPTNKVGENNRESYYSSNACIYGLLLVFLDSNNKKH